MNETVDHHAHTLRFVTTLLQRIPDGTDLHAYTWRLAGRRTRSIPLFDKTSVESLNNGTTPTEDTYFGMTLVARSLRRDERATYDTAASVPALWLDLDVADEAHTKKNYPPDRDAVLEIVSSMGTPPTMTVWSGHGAHAYWVLAEPLRIESEADRATAAALCAGWVGLAQDIAAQRGYDLDPVGDLARVLRLPGTLNMKVPGQPCLAEVLDDSGPLHDPIALAELIGARRSPDGPRQPVEQPAVERDHFTLDPNANPPDRWLDLQRRPRVLAAFNHEREDLPSPSECDLSMAVVAARAGWTDQQIVDLLVASRRGNGVPIKRLDYYQRTLAKARAGINPDGDPSVSGDPDGDDGGLLAEISRRGTAPVLADLAEDNRFFAVDESGTLHLFDGGIYKPADAFLREFVRDTLVTEEATKKWKPTVASDVATFLAPGLPRLSPRPSLTHLNVMNGLVELNTRTLHPHDPSYLTKIQLPLQFDPDATCPHWDEFISEVFPPDARHVAYELIAYAMVPDPAIQKAILILGDGGEGKSTFLAGLTAFLGQSNVSSETLQRLESTRFAGSGLLGKLANIAADLPAKELEGSAMLKGITGGDVLIAERKFEHAFSFKPFARLIFSANQAPRTPDPSPAFFDRFVVIRFTRRFRAADGEISRSVLDDRLSTPQELSGLLNRALTALPDVLRRGIDEPESLQRAKAEFREATDPLSVWLDRCVQRIPDAYVTKPVLPAAYNAWADRHGYPQMHISEFGRALKRNRPNLRGGQRSVAGRRQEVWLGIAQIAEDRDDDGGHPSSGAVASIVSRLRPNDSA